MRQFEESLRRGLMDANLAQYEKVLRRADAMEPDFSPAYLRERMRLLADPRGWMRRREAAGFRRRRRLNWRLIAIVAALLLLSACAVAVVTGQFTQWFPGIWMDPKAPEVSEEIVSRMGTVIGEPQTVDGVSMTLNAAVWDGQELRLSLTADVPDLPEDFDFERLYDLECRLIMAEHQREAYLRKEIAQTHANSHIDLTKEELEEKVQSSLEDPYEPYFHPVVRVARQEDGTLILQVMAALYDYVEDPELTLHVENLATYKEEDSDEPRVFISQIDPDGTVITDHELNEPFLKGPFGFTFTLDKKLSPISYAGDVDATYENIPMRVSKITVTAFQVWTNFEVLDQIDLTLTGEDPDKLHISLEQNLAMSLNGLWTEDGEYVECIGGAAMGPLPDGRAVELDCEMAGPADLERLDE